MKVIMWILGIALFCNVLAIGIILFKHDVGWISWGNLFGCVVFGGFLRACTVK